MRRLSRVVGAAVLMLLAACHGEPVAPASDAPGPVFGKGAGAPPNPEIAFYEATSRGLFLYVMNADGSARTSVARLVDGGRSTWSSAGSGTSAQPYQLAYVDLMYAGSAGSEDCSLFVVDVWVSGTAVMASAARQLPRSAPACYIAWSPAGPELAYATGFYGGSVPGHQEIWLIGASGTNERLLYSSSARALTALDWSHDGTHLVVVEKSDDYTTAGDRLLLIDVATGAGRTLYQSPANLILGSVEFGNRSNDVLFSTQAYSGSLPTSTPSGIYRLPLSTDFAAGTPQFVVDARSASWSPDDSKLVIGATQGSPGLSIYTLATGARTSIGKGSAPCWRPQ